MGTVPTSPGGRSAHARTAGNTSGPPRAALHLAMTTYLIDPDAGGEPLISWRWVTAMSRRVDRVTLLAPSAECARLGGDRRVPDNVEVVDTGIPTPIRTNLPLPAYYRSYARFLQDAGLALREVPADIGHHICWGTPYWGSALTEFAGRRVTGPVAISDSTPLWALPDFGRREAQVEAVRSALLRLPMGRLGAPFGFANADYVLAADRQVAALAERSGRLWTAMPQDGTDPVPREQVTPHANRGNLIWIGRLMPKKGAPLAIHALKAAEQRLPSETRLLMVVDGPQRTMIEALIAELELTPRVELFGRLPYREVVALLSSSLAVVFSAVRDSFGSVVLDAAQLGTPVVTSLHKGIEGLAGWLPESAGWTPRSRNRSEFVSQIADGMVQATCGDPSEWERKSLGAHAFAACHSWERRADTMLDIYRELVW